MKHLSILMFALILTACSGAPAHQQMGQKYPVALTHLGTTVDPQTAQVDVQITVRSGFPRTLKTLRVFVALYDRTGTQIGGDEAIEILGPIKNGQTIGPLEKITASRDRSVKCVGVVRVEAVMMDYATKTLSGADANSLVDDPHSKRCVTAS